MKSRRSAVWRRRVACDFETCRTRGVTGLKKWGVGHCFYAASTRCICCHHTTSWKYLVPEIAMLKKWVNNLAWKTQNCHVIFNHLKLIFVWILITYIEDFTFNCTYSRVLFVCCIFIALVLSNLSLFYFFVIACLCLAACIGEINFLISAAKWPVWKEPSLHISGCRTEVGPDLGVIIHTEWSTKRALTVYGLTLNSYQRPKFW